MGRKILTVPNLMLQMLFLSLLLEARSWRGSFISHLPDSVGELTLHKGVQTGSSSRDGGASTGCHADKTKGRLEDGISLSKGKVI